jgi:putative radical SAM enzyme (TIGR03279 family)
MNGLLVERVAPGSIGEELEIEAGDRLLAIDGHELRDIIDYHYYSADDVLTLDILKGNGEEWEIEVEKGPEESLGLFFPAPVPDQCGNRCVFCFVHQLPKGLRTPLYVKDEDYRLSFLFGNYVTLANIGPADLARIKEQRLSPLYVSVHATDPVLRARLLGVKQAPPILEIMQDLAAARITMHTQIVLCPGLNDGGALEQTVTDLAALHPLVASLAVVPVGLTSHRQRLPDLTPVESEYARRLLKEWHPRQEALTKRLGKPFLFFADEFYLKADLPFPALTDYGDLPQVENGVGMIPIFLEEAATVLEEAEPLAPLRATIVTGESPYRYLTEFLAGLARKTGGELTAIAIKNLLFGDRVTVTGLVTGRDIIAGLTGKDLGDVVFIPDVMLKEGEGIFLDDLSLEELAQALQVPVIMVEATPGGIYHALVAFADNRGNKSEA